MASATPTATTTSSTLPASISPKPQQAETVPPATVKHKACDLCKKRKVRCSGSHPCQHCSRTKRVCTYNDDYGRIGALERRLRNAEQKNHLLQEAWKRHRLGIDLEAVLQSIEAGQTSQLRQNPLPASAAVLPDANPASPTATGNGIAVSYSNDDQAPELDTVKPEDLHWDETQDQGTITDGIGSLSANAAPSGYMGPQSGNALLGYLQSTAHFLPDDEPVASYSAKAAGEINRDGRDKEGVQGPARPPSREFDQRCLDWYFRYYHPAYPLLHEGQFRAAFMGAIPKPKDGSWPVLQNMVLAVGAMVGPESAHNDDIYYFQAARSALSIDILHKGSLTYVQATALMSNYLQKRNRPNSGFVYLGVALNMALGIGLHREFADSAVRPADMEVRRRLWWTLFIFDAGARLTFGRPSMLLGGQNDSTGLPGLPAGVNLRLPSNLDDVDLAIDMDHLPDTDSFDNPTTASCLIWQSSLAVISNAANAQLLLLDHTNRLPDHAAMITLDNRIRQWNANLPVYIHRSWATSRDYVWFEVPRMVLLWRAVHLRIVITRPFLLDVIKRRQLLDLGNATEAIVRCINAAQECVQSICDFYQEQTSYPGGLVWYATYWLVTAVFVEVTCLLYDPYNSCAPAWRQQIEESRQVLVRMAIIEPIAERAVYILDKIMDLVPRSPDSDLFASSEPVRMGIPEIWNDPWAFDAQLTEYMLQPGGSG